MQILTLMAKHWKKLAGVALIVSVVAYADTISRIHTFSDGDILTSADLNAEFDNVVDGVNGITDDNIATNAAINPVKISSNIAGSGITRNTTTGQLTPTVDDVSIQVGGSGLQVKDGGIDADMMAANSVALANMKDASVGTSELVDSSVTTGKILDATITAADLAAGALTATALPAVNYVVSSASSSSTESITGSSFVDYPNLSVSITTVGRPYVVLLEPGTGGNSGIYGTGAGGAAIKILEDGVEIMRDQKSGSFDYGTSLPCSSVQVFRAGATAAAHTIKLQVNPSGLQTFDILNCKLVVREL